MPGPTRPRRAPTDDGEHLRLFVGWPAQETCEMLRLPPSDTTVVWAWSRGHRHHHAVAKRCH